CREINRAIKGSMAAASQANPFVDSKPPKSGCELLVAKAFGGSRSLSNWAWTAGGTVSPRDRKSTRLNSSHSQILYAVFCLKKKKLHHAQHYIGFVYKNLQQRIQ